MLVFGLLALRWTDKHFGTTAYYCSVLALFSVPPTALFGVLDWLQFQEGQWEALIIIKMTLTVILTILLTISVVFRIQQASPVKLFVVYLLCMACAGGLGFSGGELVYG